MIEQLILLAVLYQPPPAIVADLVVSPATPVVGEAHAHSEQHDPCPAIPRALGARLGGRGGRRGHHRRRPLGACHAA
jgi:hypothetical protein